MTDNVESTEEIPRRGFMKSAMAAVISGILGLVPVGAGLAFFLDPLLRKKGEGKGEGAKKDADGFIKMDITVDGLPADGTPQQFTVLDDQDDAWNRFVQVPVGSVWLRRNPDGEVIVFNTVCPHLGCAVSHRASDNDFFCPCHTSAFDLDGAPKNEVPPRAMDTLEIRRKTDGIEKSDGNEIWVRFMNFRAATSEKIPV